jgi:putative FmdB family regulatory protein
MPIYEYQCGHCHHPFDVLQKISDVPIQECPKCHQKAATRLVSAAGFQLKGTGWYVTDFKDNDKPKKKEDNSAASEKSDTSSTESSASTTQKQGESD